MAEEGLIPSWDDGSNISDDDLFSDGPSSNIRHRRHLQAFQVDFHDPLQVHRQRNAHENRFRGSSILSPPNTNTSSWDRHLEQEPPRSQNQATPEDGASASDAWLNISSELTDCPICLETLERPKALPCLHTFCYDCLESFIKEKAERHLMLPFKSFPCPICRRDTSPLDPTKPYKDWTHQFPTNNIMLQLIEIGKSPQNPKVSAMESHKPKSVPQKKRKTPENKYCGNCQIFNRKTVSADLRCEQCSVNLCEACDSALHLNAPDHTRIYVGVGHSEIQVELSPVTNIDPREFDTSRLECRRHGGMFEFFCMLHKCPVCEHCMKEEHLTCEGVHKFREYSRMLQTGRSGLKASLKDGTLAMETLVSLFKQRVSAMYADRDSSLEHICELRNDINHHLDEMETNLNEQISKVSKNEEHALSEVSKQCEIVNNGLNRSLVRLNAAIQDGDDKRIMSAALFCHFQIKQCADVVKEISGFHSVPRLSVQMNPLLTAMFDIDSFGETDFVREKTDLPSSVRKLLPLNSRSAREILRFNVRTHEDQFTCGITSALYLPNNQVILVDFPNKAVKLFSDYGHLVHQIRLQDGPWDICSIDGDTFAITLPFKQMIAFIERDPRTSALFRNDNKSIKLKMCCYGITSFRGGIVISCPTERKVTLFKVLRVGKHSHQLERFCKLPISCWQLVASNARREVISTHDAENGGILRISSLDRFSKETLGPQLAKGLRGCGVDKEGNVYICGRKSSNIIQVSLSTGSRVLLTSVHGLKEPSTIAVQEDKFLLAEVANNQVAIYEMF
ncbi:uncharacterized protein LOC132548217 [Ylistrum balloti]|uniref:uncharacterized protein LOC132548217 n=1 Tax=Ylistrum balloti TaxID=509963 RepID=UPI002905BA28|nr:uncharacterized protein LOC132548217 [Ylistrum balloti]